MCTRGDCSPTGTPSRWVLAAAQLAIGACLLGVAMPWLGRQQVTLTSTLILSVVALGVLSTGIAYVLNYRLIQDEGPTAASMTNHLTPVVAVLLGVLFVDERLSWSLVAGTAMVLLGVWIAERNQGGRRQPATPRRCQRTMLSSLRNAFGSVL
jgi:drug/metabolite transporter (DMT)-like permease